MTSCSPTNYARILIGVSKGQRKWKRRSKGIWVTCKSTQRKNWLTSFELHSAKQIVFLSFSWEFFVTASIKYPKLSSTFHSIDWHCISNLKILFGPFLWSVSVQPLCLILKCSCPLISMFPIVLLFIHLSLATLSRRAATVPVPVPVIVSCKSALS